MLLILMLTAARTAWAQGANDDEVRTIIEGILATEYKRKKFGEALEKLEVAQVVCEGDACSSTVRAELAIAIGMTHARMGNRAEAVESFNEALTDDPEAQLQREYASPAVEKAWAAAKKGKQAAASKGCRGSFDKGDDRPRGWMSAEAYHCHKQARVAQSGNDYKRCAADARASLELEERIDTRALLARCLEGQNRWGDAIQEYDALTRDAPRARQFSVGRRAASRSAMLQRRMPVLVLTPPSDIEDLVVKLDGTTLPSEVLNVEMPIDPGEHKVEAQGTLEGLPVTFEEDILLEPGRTLTLPIRLAQGPPKWATREELQCMLAAKSPDEFAKCINKRETKASDLNVRVGAELSGYHDDMSVDVLTPAVFFGIEHVTDGWGVGASFLVDVVTAASVDILATASPHWKEARLAPAIKGHKKFDPVDISVAASLSHEPDYLSAAVGADVAVELAQKNVTPSFGYQYSHDVNARAGTDWDVFSKRVHRHSPNVGLGLVLSKATFAQGTFTFVYEDGDLSKPYRHVPMFSPERAQQVPAGLAIEAVNLAREPERPLEQLPVERFRYAVALGIAHRFVDVTLRLSERLYIDSWGVKATTTDGRLMVDVIKELRLWPHLRFHAQSNASFYELAYAVQSSPEGQRTIPLIRTGDRELGPMLTAAFGGGAHLDLGARRQWGITLSGDAIYSRFLKHLYVLQRWGGFGALTVEAEFE